MLRQAYGQALPHGHRTYGQALPYGQERNGRGSLSVERAGSNSADEVSIVRISRVAIKGSALSWLKEAAGVSMYVV